MINYTELLEKVTDIVRESSKIMKNKDFEVTQKTSACDIVTSADFGVQSFLYQHLSTLIPSAGFFCEEKDLSDTEKEYIWVIDPIDGTTNFARGIAECAVSVALTYNKAPIIGVVYNPFQDHMFTAVKGGGAKLNGKPIHVSDRSFEKSLLCTAMCVYNKKYAPICFDIISEAYNLSNDIRRIGTCALELCYIAAGMCELYFEMRVFTWDFMAGYLILKEAGGVLYGLSGDTPPFGKPTPLVGANNTENYKKLDDIVRKYMTKIPYEEDDS